MGQKYLASAGETAHFASYLHIIDSITYYTQKHMYININRVSDVSTYHQILNNH